MRAVVEILGAAVFVLPLVVVVVYFGYDRVSDIAERGPPSVLALGAPLGWVIHAALPVGVGLFGFAVLLGVVRNVRYLMGLETHPHPRAPEREREVT